ncbi:hypothetical protein Celaphus_00014022, partial [Cervus elaphus hippelaphus]
MVSANKKQRMMVRAAVLKMKDPKQIIRDMEKLDEMEFNPVQQPQLNEKVLKDKRKKLRETFERILRLYEKENPDIYKELRKLEVEYEQKRAQLSQYFDAVKARHQVGPLALLQAHLRVCLLALLLGDPHHGYLPQHLQCQAPLPNPGVLSAPPNLIQRPKADDTSAATIEKKATATVSAKPQITNPKAEITRFVPTALR